MRHFELAGLVWLAAVGPALGAEIYNYWIQPCSQDIVAQSGCEAGDPELARWALEAWEKSSGTRVQFVAASQADARLRIYWLGARPALYGEARLIYIDGKRGAEIEVHPDLKQLGTEIASAGQKDRLFRDTVVYLTCLHEAGHGIGLEHTADFADIMYSFHYGGDIFEYFSRYRRELAERPDMRRHSGISEADRKRVMDLYASP